VADRNSADERMAASDAGSAAKPDKEVRSGVGQYSGASALAEHRESLEKHEFMLGTERGRLAVSLVSSRNPTKPALDLQTVLDQINGAKQLIQSTMSELERKRDSATKPGALP
jgi:hypothetical protein